MIALGIWILLWFFMGFALLGVLATVVGALSNALLSRLTSNPGLATTAITMLTTLVPLAIWTLLSLPMIYAFLWRLAGQEVIAVDQQGVTLQRQIFGRGRKRKYAAGQIDNLRVYRSEGCLQTVWDIIVAYNFAHLTGHRPAIAFNYGRKTVRFGGSCDKEAAGEIVTAIQQRLG